MGDAQHQPRDPFDELFAAVRRWTARYYPGFAPQSLRIEFSPHGRVSLPVPVGSAAPVRDEPASPRRHVHHSVDFRSCNWFGHIHTFTPLQAACVRVLWDAWENGTPTLGQQAVLAAAGSEQQRLGHVFRDVEGEQHPAWGTMIVPAGKGLYRLEEPAEHV